MTRKAAARLAVTASVALVVGMTLRTMCLTSIDAAHAIAPKIVLPIGHRLQVIRVDTRLADAQMIEGQPCRDRPDRCFPDRPVSHSTARATTDLAVPLRHPVAGPVPAVGTEVDALNERVDGS